MDANLAKRCLEGALDPCNVGAVGVEQQNSCLTYYATRSLHPQGMADKLRETHIDYWYGKEGRLEFGTFSTMD